MKKILSGWLALVLLLTCLLGGVSVAAEEAAATLQVDSAAVSVGDTFTVALRMANNPGLAKIKTWISYDSTVLELVDHAEGDFSGISWSLNHSYNPYYISWTSSGNINRFNDGALATLTFKVLAQASCVTEVRVDYSAADTATSSGVGVSFETVSGTVKVGETTPGDVDSDGTVTIRDLTTLQRYLADWDVAVDLAASDVYGDSAVNNKDLVILQRYLNGWDVTLDSTPIAPAPKVALPAAEYDLDNRGRIFVRESYAVGRIAFIRLYNKSTSWITEETAKVEYTCYDAAGQKLKTDYLYLGSIDTKKKKDVVISMVMPEGTAEVRLGKATIVYWTEWA